MLLLLPRYVWRFVWWWAPLCLVAFTSMLLMSSGREHAWLQRAMIAAVGLASVMLLIAHIRLDLRLRKTGCLICLRCGYDLRGVPERGGDGRAGRAGQCPECGRAFAAEEVREVWRRYLIDRPAYRLLLRWLRK